MKIYAKLGVLYYVIYNPNFWRRDRHLPFEVYKRVGKDYQLESGEPFWMPEIGLGLGRCTLPTDPLNREALGWFDPQGQRYPTPAELAEQAQQRANYEQQRANTERQQAEQERQRAERLAEKLRELSIDPDTL